MKDPLDTPGARRASKSKPQEQQQQQQRVQEIYDDPLATQGAGRMQKQQFPTPPDSNRRGSGDVDIADAPVPIEWNHQDQDQDQLLVILRARIEELEARVQEPWGKHKRRQMAEKKRLRAEAKAAKMGVEHVAETTIQRSRRRTDTELANLMAIRMGYRNVPNISVVTGGPLIPDRPVWETGGEDDGVDPLFEMVAGMGRALNGRYYSNQLDVDDEYDYDDKDEYGY